MNARGMLSLLWAFFLFPQAATSQTDPLLANPAPLESSVSSYDSANAATKNDELTLLRITPSGEDVPNSNRQIVFTFNQPVVPIGEMSRDSADIPISISPLVECEWRWLNVSALACQLSKVNELKLASKYSVTVQPGIVTSAGVGMQAPVTHSFITERPKIRNTRLNNWRQADRPAINLYFNQPVTKASVLDTVAFKSSDSEPIKVTIDEELNPLTDAFFQQSTEGAPFAELVAIPLGKTTQSQAAALVRARAERGNAFAYARTLWSVTPNENLPADAQINVSLDSGLTSIYGKQVGRPKAVVKSFKSLPEFKFLGIRCTTAGSYEALSIEPRFSSNGILRNTDTGVTIIPKLAECGPLNPVALIFTSPVSYATADSALTVTPDLAGNIPDYKPWSTRNDSYAIQAFFSHRFSYDEDSPFFLTLPESLQAYEQYSLVSNDKLVDEVGRELPVKIDMSFLTSHRAPRLVSNHRHSVLEKNVESEVPITVTNLATLKVDNYATVTVSQRRENLNDELAMSDVEDIAYNVPLGVRKLLNNQSGVVIGSLNSDPMMVDYQREYYRFISQVTPFQVHLKFGHFNSYAWVTDLATGQPVKDAMIRLERDAYSTLTPFGSFEGAIKTDSEGVAKLPGIIELDPDLSLINAYRYDDERLMLKVAKGDDFAVLPIEQQYSAWANLWPRLKRKDSYSHAWGTTAQGVYKAGDKIQYKLYLRDQSNQHWVAPRLSGYDLELIDPTGQTVKREKNLTLSEFGSFSGEFTTTDSAAVGWYQFKLTRANVAAGDKKLQSWLPMQVLVTDFTPAPFRVSTELNGDQFTAGDTVSVTTQAQMHAGGPYADAQSSVRATLYPKSFSSSHPQAKDFHFDHVNSRTSVALHSGDGVIDKAGELVTDFTVNDVEYHYGRISVESSVRDDRGKSVASSASASFLGRDRFVGLRNTDWVHDAGKKMAIEHLVVDVDGQPVADTNVNTLIEHSVTRAARVKGAGNAYLTQYSTEWVKVGGCAQFSKDKAVRCELVPKEPGSYRFTATIKDQRGRANSSQAYTWVVGDGAVVWSGKDNHQIEIVPDAESYKIGDVAKFLIKNPYPGAQALITVERYGVLRHWRQALKGATPVIEVPIEANDYPGVYLSVVISSPRVAQPLGEGNVDLGKPSFKMGYVAVPVQDEHKQITVDVKTDREIYKPREKVTVSLKAKPRNGKKVPVELAVVVIDEAVFDLNKNGRDYYNPYAGFNHLENLGVANYNLLMKLIGRQKFEKKGANPGGGGGEGDLTLRNIDKYVAYWNPSIKVDKKGRAKLDFKLPDNLTGWRVFAMAVSTEDKMGLGDVGIKVNRPTELRPVMPNQLTEGDTVQAGFSVMNRTDKSRTVKVELRGVGSALSVPVIKKVELELAAYERQRVWMPVTADAPGELAFFATAGDSLDRDAIEHHVPVTKRRSLITAASYGTTTAESVSENIAFPEGIYNDVGGLSVEVAPSVVGNVAGAFRYLRDYPYRCWEQRLSKGLAASQYNALRDYLPVDLRWSASATLPEQTLQSASTFQAPNGGMTYWVNENRNVSPYLSAYTALGFAWLHEQGHRVPKEVEDKLHDYLQRYLRASTPDDGTHESTHSVRASIHAVALAALGKRGKLSASDLARYEGLIPEMDLFGKAHFLQAATDAGTSDEKLLAISEEILSYSGQSGVKFQFSEPDYASAGSILHSPMRSNCAILTSFMAVSQKSKEAMSLLGDVPFKQVRAITQARAGRDFWANTQENLFCMNALRNFSQLYESDAPNMELLATLTSKTLGEQKFGSVEFSDLQDEPVILENPELSVEPGLRGEVTLTKKGRGRFYYGVRMSYAKTDDNAERINAGLEVRREYSVQQNGEWVMLDAPLTLTKGDLVRVDLFVSSPTARHFVVVDDPVPGGLEPVNRDLATSSQLQIDYQPDSKSWWHSQSSWTSYGGYASSFYHQELRHDSTRFYSDYLPSGNYHLTYTAQAIAGGKFSVLPVKAQEMYDPDVFGIGLPTSLTIEQAKP